MSCLLSSKSQYALRSQRGAALVIALLVFALAAALMVGVQRDFTLQLQRSTNTFFAEQGWSFLLGAESLAELVLRQDSDEDGRSEAPVDSLLEVWAQPQAPFPLDGIGFLSGDLSDLQGRFNLNGLVTAPRQPSGESPSDGENPAGDGPDASQSNNQSRDLSKRLNTQQRVFLRLLLSIEEAELSRAEATRLVERVSDFIDSDRTPRLDGAESEVYLASAFPYRPPNRPLASVSELRGVDGFTPELYRLIAPFLTVWPVDGSKVNILTASPQLLAALAGDDAFEPLSAQEVARIVELRSGGMIADVETFLSDALFTNSTTTELREIIDIKSDWFLLDARVEIADRERRLYSVLHRQGRAVSVVHRTEGEL